MPGTIKQSDMINGLTPMQERFSQCVVDPTYRSLSESYAGAGYSVKNKQPSTINEAACRLMANSKIVARVERLNAAKTGAVSASAVSDTDHVLANLRKYADNAENSDNARIRATELLGKTVGLFKDVIETTVYQSPEEVERELLERLAALDAGQDDKPGKVH